MPMITNEHQHGVIADMQGPVAYWGPPVTPARRSASARHGTGAATMRAARSPRPIVRARSRGHWRARRASA